MIFWWICGEKVVSRSYSSAILGQPPAKSIYLHIVSVCFHMIIETLSGCNRNHTAHWPIVVVQSPSRVRLFVTPWTAAHQVSLSFTISQSLLKLMSIQSVMLSNSLILCHPLLFLPSIFPGIRIFFNELAVCIRWPKYCSFSFSFSISPSSEYSRLTSLKID